MVLKKLLSAFLCFGLCFAAAAAEIPRPSPEFVIRMAPGGQSLVSQYKGKILVLFLVNTTCAHCQTMTPKMSAIQSEYGARGVQVVGVAFNPMANMLVGDFIKHYRPNFPVGWSDREPVYEYLQHSPVMQMYVPILVFIDRQGVIRGQHLGDSPLMSDPEKNIRATLDGMLKAPATSKKAGPVTKSASNAKKGS